MTKLRVLASILVIGLAGLSVGAVSAWFSDSATIQVEIEAADDFEDDEPAKVWVCKLVGPADAPFVAPGKNPIQVSIDSVDAAEGFSDAHPSYVVENGEVECVAPTSGDQTTSDIAEVLPVPTTPTTTSTTPTSTTTTTALTTTTTTTSATTTTTTTTMPAPTTTTTLPQAGS